MKPLTWTRIWALTLVVAASFAATAAAQETADDDYASLRELLRAGKYVEMEREARALLAREEAADGPESLAVARAIGPLLEALFRGGKTSDPEYLALAKRALRIRAARLGSDDEEVLSARNNLAAAHLAAGDSATAVRIHEETLARKLEVLGPRHPSVAKTMANLASALRQSGDYARSRALYEQALEIWEQTAGPDDPETARTVSNLANLLEEIGDLERARDLHQRVLEIRRRAYGENHPQVGISCHNLAETCRKLGDYGEAIRLERRALAIFARTVGAEHPVNAAALNTLGTAHRGTGDAAAAERDFRRALEIWEASAGERSAEAATAHHSLGSLALDAGEYEVAREHLERAREIWTATLGPEHPWVADTRASLARIAWLAGEAKAAFGAALEIERTVRDQFRDVAAGLSEREALAYEGTRTLALDVALSILAAGRTELPSDSARRIWDALVRSRALVLDEMASRHREKVEPRRPNAGLAEVVSRLPGHTALVAFVYFHRFSLGRRDSEASYLAFVLAPAGRAQPRIVDLGAAATVDALIAAWRTAVASAPADPAAVARYRETGARLSAAIWNPLGPAIGDARQVFVVPDGAVHLVNLATLPAGAESYLVERGPRLHYLSTERDLLDDDDGRRKGAGILIVGAPDFDARPSPAPTAGDVYRGSTAACGGFHSLRFPALPGTGAEAEEVAALWIEGGSPDGPPEVLTGLAATEQAVKRDASRAKVLHLATHGFFVQDRCRSLTSLTGNVDSGAMPDPVGESPLLLAGLALAGANLRHGGGEDGILTAEEIAALDLRQVEWAVLSACNTGVGPVVAGEGVLGLRRAFEMAGARTTIMSLWSVSDHETRAWIRRLYAARLDGLTTVDAVSRASLDVIAARRKAGVTAHPFYWGAFVAAGDWR